MPVANQSTAQVLGSVNVMARLFPLAMKAMRRTPIASVLAAFAAPLLATNSSVIQSRLTDAAAGDDASARVLSVLTAQRSVLDVKVASQ
jgi:hypothetical protein